MARIVYNTLILVALFCSTLGANAEPIRLGAPLPWVKIDNGGEIELHGTQTSTQPWQSTALVGKSKQLLIHVAGRLSAKQQLSDVIQHIQRARLSAKQVHTTTIVNIDDSLWGSGPFVEQSIIGSKKDQPQNSFVIDNSGIAAHRWQLLAHRAAIVVTDAQGNVQFFQQSPFSPLQVQQLITLLKN